MIGDTLSAQRADTLPLFQQGQTAPVKAASDSLQLTAGSYYAGS